MATDTNKTNIEKETSFLTYIGKEIYQTTVGLVGAVGGTLLGIFATKPFFKDAVVSKDMQAIWKSQPWISKIPGLGKPISDSQLKWGGLGGLFVGVMAAGMTLGYEHWKKIKQAQLQVDEITRDISEIEVFKKTDPELAAENKRLWAELKKRDDHAASGYSNKASHGARHDTKSSEHGSHASRHAKHESWQESASAAEEHAGEAQR
jgi:hypothetical protein